jgi:hypothetical protein
MAGCRILLAGLATFSGHQWIHAMFQSPRITYLVPISNALTFALLCGFPPFAVAFDNVIFSPLPITEIYHRASYASTGDIRTPIIEDEHRLPFFEEGVRTLNAVANSGPGVTIGYSAFQAGRDGLITGVDWSGGTNAPALSLTGNSAQRSPDETGVVDFVALYQYGAFQAGEISHPIGPIRIVAYCDLTGYRAPGDAITVQYRGAATFNGSQFWTIPLQSWSSALPSDDPYSIPEGEFSISLPIEYELSPEFQINSPCCVNAWGDIDFDISRRTYFPAVTSTATSWIAGNLMVGARPPVEGETTGDFNDSGAVEAADYVVYRKGLWSTHMPDHYDLWKKTFGESAGSGGSSSNIPEPSSITLFALAILGLGLRRRR